MSKKSLRSKQQPSGVLSAHNKEIWAFALLFTSAFLFIATQFSNATGFLGDWVVSYIATYLFGVGVHALPVFLASMSLFLFFKEGIRTRALIIGLTVPFWVTLVYLEFNINGAQPLFPTPIPVNGGGFFGVTGAYVLYRLFGSHGSGLFLMFVMCTSLVLVFNLSLKSVTKSFLKTLQSVLMFVNRRQIGDADPFHAQDPFSWLKSIRNLYHFLFFKTQKDTSYNESDLYDLQDLSDPKLRTMSDESDVVDVTPTPIVKASAKTEPLDELPEPSPSLEDLGAAATDFAPPKESSTYQYPSIQLLEKPRKPKNVAKSALKSAQDKAALLEETLVSFNVNAQVVNITVGPSVTRYELKPGLGVKISKITNLSQDIALKLAAADVRIEAPIPGKSLVGIEVPNDTVDVVTMRTIIQKSNFMELPSKLSCAVGLTITGDPIVMQMDRMPHLLIAGATGAGKSVCINSLVLSILLRASPEEVKFLMIDPKKVELSLYDHIPHLLAPVVTDPGKAAATLKQWALVEMERRYEEFSKAGVKDITGYNRYVDSLRAANEKLSDDELAELPTRLPYIVVIIDELADLMMTASHEVESAICRLAQMARATGIHLIIATQRPTVNVVTGLIKANVPSRISFAVQSQIDSRTILDMGGAEKLVGKGDMLYLPVGGLKPQRVQGVFISEDEVKRVVRFVRGQGKPTYSQELLNVEPISEEKGKSKSASDDLDDLFDQAKEIVQSTQYASTSYLQRKLRVGYNRAARLMDQLEEEGVISAYDADQKTRHVITS